MNNRLHTGIFYKKHIIKTISLVLAGTILPAGCGAVRGNAAKPETTEIYDTTQDEPETTEIRDTAQDEPETIVSQDAVQDESETKAQETDTAEQEEADVEFPYDEYEKVDDFGTYLVTETDEQNKTETKTIYYFNSHTEQPVELRNWNLTWTREEDGKAELYIWDCMEKAVIYDGEPYDGEVEWKALAKLADDEYFQDLFWKDLHRPGNPSADETIPTAKYTPGGGEAWNFDLENIDYKSREALLADCGFQDEEPFYQYYDRFGNLELELYFDDSEGKGCGFRYSHAFNYESEKVVWCNGFIFEGTGIDKWKDDTYSLLTWEDMDAREQDDVTRVIYEYTDDGRLSRYEVRGLTYLAEAQWYEGLEITDAFFISIDWVYRSDGTLYRKYYNHNSMVFATTGQSQWVYYDEQGRPIYKHEYITHGSYDYYYIYEGDNTIPKYCLSLDQDGGYSIPVMYVYR